MMSTKMYPILSGHLKRLMLAIKKLRYPTECKYKSLWQAHKPFQIKRKQRLEKYVLIKQWFKNYYWEINLSKITPWLIILWSQVSLSSICSLSHLAEMQQGQVKAKLELLPTRKLPQAEMHFWDDLRNERLLPTSSAFSDDFELKGMLPILRPYAYIPANMLHIGDWKIVCGGHFSLNFRPQEEDIIFLK